MRRTLLGLLVAATAITLAAYAWRGVYARYIADDYCTAAILASRLIESWWLVLPDLPQHPPFWLDLAAMLALGGLMLLLFLRRLRFGALALAGAGAT